MNARRVIFTFFVAFLVPGVVSGKAEDMKRQALCPVMGGKIDKKVYADHEGKRVYFCCSGCIAEFKKDPEKYIQKLEDEGITLERVGAPQTNCPVMGGKINKDVYVDHEGKRIYFCCAGCIPEFKKDPEQYIKKLRDDGVCIECAPKQGAECETECPAKDVCGSCE